MQKLLKAHYFMNEMHEYKMKSFLKTLELNPDLPNIKTLKHKNIFCIKIKEIYSWMATTSSHTI